MVVSLMGVSDYPVEILNWHRLWFTQGIGYRPDDGFPSAASGLGIASENHKKQSFPPHHSFIYPVYYIFWDFHNNPAL